MEGHDHDRLCDSTGPSTLTLTGEALRSMRIYFLLLTPLCLAVLGCSTKEVKDFASWCDYIHDPKMGQYDVLSLDKEAVIDGVVSAWDRIIAENSAHVLGVPADSIATDRVMAELRKARAIGAWKAGDTLNFALTLIPSPVLDPSRTEAETMADQYRMRLSSVNHEDAKGKMDPMTYCLYSGITVYFARLDVHTSDGTASVRNEVFEQLKKYNRSVRRKSLAPPDPTCLAGRVSRLKAPELSGALLQPSASCLSAGSDPVRSYQCRESRRWAGGSPARSCSPSPVEFPSRSISPGLPAA